MKLITINVVMTEAVSRSILAKEIEQTKGKLSDLIGSVLFCKSAFRDSDVSMKMLRRNFESRLVQFSALHSRTALIEH